MPDLETPEQLNTDTAEQAEGNNTTETGDYTGPKGEVDLPATLVKALETICRKMDQRELQPRLNQVARCQKARMFWRSIQFLKREQTEGANGTIYAPIDMDAKADSDRMYPFNIYKGYGKSFVATFAQAPAGVRFEPNDMMVPSDVAAAKEAESARKIICKVNNQKDIQKQVARYAWTDGLVVFHSRQVTSPKYGFDKDGNPRSYPEIEVGGALEWKVPIAAGGFDDWDYVRNQREISLTKAKADYPEKASKLAATTGTSKDLDYSRQARVSVAEGLGLQTQSGDAQATSVTRSRYWLRPSAFQEIEDNTIKSELKDWFPTGAHVCFIGETYVESRDESMDDHIEAFKPVDDDGFNAPGLGNEEIGPQEVFNVLANLARTAHERTVPHKYIDKALMPPEAVKEQSSTYGNWHIVEGRPGEPISNSFFEESSTEVPASLMTLLDNIQGPLSQFLTGQQPALFGGEMGEAGETAAGYQQALAQAMGLMGLVWIPFKKAWACVVRQCVRILGDSYPTGTTLQQVLSKNNGENETVTVNVDNLKGQFLAYPDTDENFPESWTAKRAAFSQLMMTADKNPALGGILSHPDNLRLGKDLVGIPDLTIPGADSDEKQMQEIEEMEKQAPVPDPQAMQQVQQLQAQGQIVTPEMLQALPLVSSVDIDPEFDDHATEYATCTRWINSNAGQKAKRDNPQWFQNVRLHALQHKKIMEQNQAGGPQKPPSESINFKDLPPAGKAQLAAQAGIQLSPDEIAADDETKAMAKSQQQPVTK